VQGEIGGLLTTINDNDNDNHRERDLGSFKNQGMETRMAYG